MSDYSYPIVSSLQLKSRNKVLAAASIIVWCQHAQPEPTNKNKTLEELPDTIKTSLNKQSLSKGNVCPIKNCLRELSNQYRTTETCENLDSVYSYPMGLNQLVGGITCPG